MSTVYTVSWAVLAAMIGQGAWHLHLRGVSANDNGLILLGAVPAAILAFVAGSW